MFDPHVMLAATAAVAAAGACTAGAASAFAHAELERMKRGVGEALARAFGDPDPAIPSDLAETLARLDAPDAADKREARP